MCIITRFYHITRSKAAVKGTTSCIVDYSAYPAGGNKVADHRELYPGLALHSGNNRFNRDVRSVVIPTCTDDSNKRQRHSIPGSQDPGMTRRDNTDQGLEQTVTCGQVSCALSRSPSWCNQQQSTDTGRCSDGLPCRPIARV